MKHRGWPAAALLSLVLWMIPLWPALADDGGRNVILRENYVLKSGDRRVSDLTVVAGRVELQESSVVEGNVVLMGGEALVDGTVRGNVIAWGGQLSLGPSALVEGDVVIFGPFRRDASAQVRGTVIDGLHPNGVTGYLARLYPRRPAGAPTASPMPAARSREVGYATGSLITLLMVLGGAALVITLLPTQVARVGRAMSTHALLSLGIGALTIVLVLVLLPILIILCLGIPFAIVLAIAFALCGVLGWVAAGRMVGHRIAFALHLHRVSVLGEAFLGTLVIALLSAVPCLGLLLALGLACWGVGGAVLTRLGTSDYPPDMPWLVQPKIGPPQVTPLASPEQPSTPAAPDFNKVPEEPKGPWTRDTRPLSEAEIWGP